MKKILIWIVAGIIIVGAGLGIAYSAGLFGGKTTKAVESVEISGESIIVIDTPTTYTAVILPADATDKTVTWAVTAGDAEITTGGVLTAAAAGDVTITATSNNDKIGIKTITVYADQTTADNASIAAAKNAVENASYTVTQADVIDIETANVFLETLINELSLNGVTVEISEDTFTAAIAGTTGDADGTNGSYTFSVTLNKGNGTEQITSTLTLTITAIPYDSEVEEQDNADITAAKATVEGATYTANQSAATDVVTAKTSIQTVINGLSLDGVHYAITNGTFTAATAGTVGDADGTDGSFSFTVKLNKGLGAEQITDTLTLTITATPYDSTTQDNEDITAAKAAVEGAIYNANQADVTDAITAKAAVQSVINGLSLNGVTAVIVDGAFAAATAGAIGNETGTNGSFAFIVELNKDKGNKQTTNNLTLTIVATPLDNNARVAAAKAAIEDILDNDAVYSSVNCGGAGNETQTLRTYITGLVEDIDELYGVNLGVSVQQVSPAVDGTVQAAAGTNGSAEFTVEVVYGNGEISEIITRNITILPSTIFTDDDTIGDALTLLDTALPQALDASAANNLQTAMYNLVNTECDQLKGSHDITYSITNPDFKAAVNGVKPQIGTENAWEGTDGSYTCTVTIGKNDGTPRVLEVSIALVAKDYATGNLSFSPVTVGGVSGLEVSANNLNPTDDTSIVIPAEDNGDKVLRIVNGGPDGFNGKAFIKLVIIPEGVMEIGTDAFANCAGLQYVAIPNSVESILSGAFQYCTSLESIALPDNQNFTTITTDSFRGTGLKSIELPGKVTTLESTAFFGCLELTSITMDGVTTIGNGAFNGCAKLVDLTLSQNVESIGGAAFYGISIVLHIENPEIEFRGNVFSQNTVVEIYFNGTQSVFEDLEIYTYNTVTSVWEISGTTVHSTLPEKTKVYFKQDPSDPNSSYTPAVIYNEI